MLSLSISNAKKILCLGAHSDDIEIGCGATLLTLTRNNPNFEVLWIVFSAKDLRAAEARSSANAFLENIHSKNVVVKDFRESFFPSQTEQIKKYFEEIKTSFDPEIVFTHCREDRHQDHRILSDLTWNTFRNHTILEYEIPKFDGDFGNPNTFIEIDTAIANRKVEYLSRFFKSQANKHWFSEELFLGLMRIRGMECACEYAEAFYGRKVAIKI